MMSLLSLKAMISQLEFPVAALTIRNLDADLKSRLRRRAAGHDRSMEEEARVILREALKPASHEGLATSIRKAVERLGGGVDFDLPADEPFEPMRFDEE